MLFASQQTPLPQISAQSPTTGPETSFMRGQRNPENLAPWERDALIKKQKIQQEHQVRLPQRISIMSGIMSGIMANFYLL